VVVTTGHHQREARWSYSCGERRPRPTNVQASQHSPKTATKTPEHSAGSATALSTLQGSSTRPPLLPQSIIHFCIHFSRHNASKRPCAKNHHPRHRKGFPSCCRASERLSNTTEGVCTTASQVTATQEILMWTGFIIRIRSKNPVPKPILEKSGGFPRFHRFTDNAPTCAILVSIRHKNPIQHHTQRPFIAPQKSCHPRRNRLLCVKIIVLFRLGFALMVKTALSTA